jgi:hypothetical protein
MVKRWVAFVLSLAFFWLPLAEASVSGKEIMYVGGTIAGLSEGTIGSLDTTSEKVMVFNSPKGKFEVPYENVTSLEYGQKAGRRLGVTIITGNVFYLLSKKRKHFLTIGYTDANEKPQGVVLEIPKGTAKSFITILEVRSGKKVEYESEEAKKHVHG